MEMREGVKNILKVRVHIYVGLNIGWGRQFEALRYTSETDFWWPRAKIRRHKIKVAHFSELRQLILHITNEDWTIVAMIARLLWHDKSEMYL